MTEPSLLMLQFLAWVADRPRSYREVMEAWRSNCPRHPVWEDAVIDGLVRVESGGSRAVTLTARGRALLDQPDDNAMPQPCASPARSGRRRSRPSPPSR